MQNQHDTPAGLADMDLALMADILRRHGYRVVRHAERPDGPGHVHLSPRQVEVIRTLWCSPSLETAAHALCVSVGTLRRQQATICVRIGVSSRMAMYCWACRHGLLDACEPPGEANDASASAPRPAGQQAATK